MSDTTWQDTLNTTHLAPGGWYGCAAPDGWETLILTTHAQLAFIDPDYKIQQIKEKFGTLRYYYDTNKTGIEHDIMNAIVSTAEARSAHTCQNCGKHGTLRGGYWMATLCDNCHEQTQQNQPER